MEGSEVESLPPEEVADLLDQALGFLDRYVVLPGDSERHAVALWLAHSWAFDGAHATPYLLVLSPEKRSGKTRLLETIDLLVARPWRITGASEAAIFRKIEQDRPTLLLDEIDAIFGSHSERTEPLRAMFDAGNRPGAAVSRVVGERHEVCDFSVFCPKVLAGIDKGHLLPDTIRDRSIPISMQRKTAAEPVARFRYRDANAQAQIVREGLERWAAEATDPLLAADPNFPPRLDDRAAEAWEPLLAIADMAGGEWPERARTAAVALGGDGDDDESTIGSLLLAALRDAFGEADRATTAKLLATINADEELPFGGWRDGKGLDGRKLAKLLRPYGVQSRTIWLDGGKTAKGYLREQFSNVWSRWLPSLPVEPSGGSGASGGTGAVSEISHEKADLTDMTDLTDIDGADGSGSTRNGNEAVPATPEEEAEAERIAAKFEVGDL